MAYAYPYNPLANNPSCIVPNEVHALSEYTNKWRCIVPIYAPFFRDSLIIVHVDTGRTLIEGIDFYLTHYCKTASTVTKRAVFGSIMLTMPLTGRLEFRQYMTLGGQFNVRRSDVLIHLADVDMADPRNEDWEVVMRYIRPVEPISAPNNIEEAISLDIVAAAINKLTAKYVTLNATRVDAIKALFDYIWNTTKTLKVPPGGTKSIPYYGARSMLVDYDLLGHQYRHDPHGITYQQLGAYGKNDDVVSSKMVYALRLDEIVEFIYFCGVNDVVLDRLYDLAGGPFVGSLALTDAPDSMISSNRRTADRVTPYSSMAFAGGSLTIRSFHDINIDVLLDGGGSTAGLPISGGNNVLMVSDTVEGDGFYPATFNGNRFISLDELDDAIGNSGSTTKPIIDIKTANSETITVSGNGRSSPLVASLVKWQATTSKEGMFQLSQSSTDTSITRIATAVDFKDHKAEVDRYALKSYKINGKPLTADITMTTLDLGLDKVQNTRLYEKGVSKAFAAVLPSKAAIDHTHDFANKSFAHATATERGLVKLTDTFSATDVINAATPQVLIPFKTQYDIVAAISDSKFSKDWVNIAKFNKGTASFAGWTLHVNTGTGWNIRGYTGVAPAADFDLTLAFPDNYRNKTFYINMDLSITEPDTAAISISDVYQDDSESRTLIGVVTTSTSAITSVKMLSAMRFINVAELIEHRLDMSAHGWGNPLHALALDNLNNKPLFDSGIMPSFSDVFNKWYRFSHLQGYGFPANSGELNTWTYDAAADTIKNTTNSVTLIGMVSNETVGDYVFDVVMSSTGADDDFIGIVLAYYKDPVTGYESTLTATRVSNAQDQHGANNFRITYNYGHNDAVILYRGGVTWGALWPALGSARVRAERIGNIIKIYSYQASGVNSLQPLEATYILDLSKYAYLAKFMGETRYGYCSYSQPNCYWLTLEAPHIDGTSRYGSMEAVRQVAMASNDMLLSSGVVLDGNYVPLPLGYSKTDVKCIVMPQSVDAINAAIKSYSCDVDSNLLVTMKAVAEDNTIWKGFAKYYLYGVK